MNRVRQSNPATMTADVLDDTVAIDEIEGLAIKTIAWITAVALNADCPGHIALRADGDLGVQHDDL